MKKRPVLWGTLIVTAIAVLGCDRQPMESLSPVRGEPEGEAAYEPGIHPLLSAPGWSSLAGGPLLVRLELKSVEVPGSIASYEGTLRYNAEKIQLNRASVPEGLTGVFNEIEPGMIRFAGVSLDGMGGLPILLLEVESDIPISPEDFQVELQEIIGSEGFNDLTDRVVPRSHPVLIH